MGTCMADLQSVTHFLTVLEMLALLVAANGTPVLAKWILGRRGAAPLDGGKRLRDGRPLFGESKTFRGLLLAIAATALTAWVLGRGAGLGALFGLLAMAGDLGTSFAKRRFGLPPHSRAFPFDYLAESLLPLAVLARPLGLSVLDIAAGVAAFSILNFAASRVLFRLGIRERPY